MQVKDFFKKFAMGAVIGAAMIIPGVSGGTIAVLLNVYDKLIGAISDLRKDFKNSFFFLLPIALGMIVAVAAMYYPLKFALGRAPLATVLLFAGLMVGSFPKMLKDGIKNGIKPVDAVSIILPLAAVIGICFIPAMGEANLGVDMKVGGYFLLILMGILSSCALVVPGISGSMLLLIFGYYQPLLATVSALRVNLGHSLLVFAMFAIGIIVGFFSIAKLMKFLLNKFPRATNWAIIGFVVGSIPAIFITFADNFAATLSEYPITIPQIVVGAILCAAGIIGSYALTALMERKVKNQEEGFNSPQE